MKTTSAQFASRNVAHLDVATLAIDAETLSVLTAAIESASEVASAIMVAGDDVSAV